MSTTLYWKVEATAAGTTYDLSLDLSSFTVEEEDRAPTLLTVQLADPFTVLSHALQEGVDLTAELGTDDDHSLVFAGKIYHVDSSLPQNGTPMLTLKAYDTTMAMGLVPRNRPFANVHLSDVVRRVTEPYLNGITLDLQLAGDPLYGAEGLRQREETDLRFLRRLARDAQSAMGIQFSDDGNTLLFKPQQAILQEAPELVLYYGRCDVDTHLLTFDSQADVSSITLPRSISAMDPATGEIVEPRETAIEDVVDMEDALLEDNLAAFETRHADRGPAIRELIAATESLGPEIRAALGTSRREAVSSFASSDQVVQEGEQQPSASLHGEQSTGSLAGNKDLHARMAIGVEGGGRFSGTWYVSKATHTLDRQGYRTEFTCQR
jgi:phage protein D